MSSTPQRALLASKSSRQRRSPAQDARPLLPRPPRPGLKLRGRSRHRCLRLVGAAAGYTGNWLAGGGVQDLIQGERKWGKLFG